MHPAGTAQPAPSAAAGAIPANYLALFKQTGRKYGIPWPVLAGIGEVESGDGANDGPSTAGALGPMQFLPATWKIYGHGGNITDPAKPYIWGGTGPGGFDCSGLIYAAYRSAGITLPRTTFGMWDLTPHIPEKDAEAGDIVFFNTGPGTAPDHPGHAGLVIGGGRMVIANCTTCGPITTASYASYPALAGFVRPLADPAIVK